jgi:hypothetical protein
VSRSSLLRRIMQNRWQQRLLHLRLSRARAADGASGLSGSASAPSQAGAAIGSDLERSLAELRRQLAQLTVQLRTTPPQMRPAAVISVPRYTAAPRGGAHR